MTSDAAPAETHAGGQSTEPTRPPLKGVRVERRALRDEVYDAILEMLLDGRLWPDESVSIDRLARELDVSPTPVREALVQLENTELVSRAALRGYRVSPPLSLAHMKELLDARVVVEVAAARGATPASAEVIAELRAAHATHKELAENLQRMRDANPGQPDIAVMRTYYDADLAFHEVILQNCGNHYLRQMAERLAPHVHRLRQTVGSGLLDVNQAVAEHAQILAAIASGDREAAAIAMTDHIQEVRTRSLADY